MQVIAWVLEHVSVGGIVAIIHAWTLHSFLCGKLAFELRVGKRLVMKMSRAGVLDRTL